MHRPRASPPLDRHGFFRLRSEEEGSIIGCETQSLGESIPIVGTPFSLHYASTRQPGRKTAYTVDVPLTGATVPPGVKRIEVEVAIAGKTITHTHDCTPTCGPNLVWSMPPWDGKDAYGRLLQGRHRAVGRTGFAYNGEYKNPRPPPATSTFASSGTTSITGSFTRQEITLWTNWERLLGNIHAVGLGMGGWTLSVHHNYDPVSKTLELGDGSTRQVVGLQRQIKQITTNPGAGPGSPGQLAIGPKGDIYTAYSLFTPFLIKRTTPNGDITTLVGGGGPSCGAGPESPTSCSINPPRDVAVGPDGAVYFTTVGNDGSPGCYLRKVTGNTMVAVAGNGTCGSTGDNGPATSAQITPNADFEGGLVVGADGTIFFSERHKHRVRRVAPDGTITTFAGDGTMGDGTTGNGGPAHSAAVGNPSSLALGPDGSLYLLSNVFRVRRVGPDGIIRAFAGSGSAPSSGDGGLATLAGMVPRDLAVAPDGTVYIPEQAGETNCPVRRVGTDGMITTFAGKLGSCDFSGLGGYATAASFPRHAVAVHPSGALILSYELLLQVAAPWPGFSNAGFIIASTDGAEAYIFDFLGRHLKTRDTRTGADRYTFGYTNGRLTTVTDVLGGVTTLTRDGSGNLTAIASPYSQSSAVVLYGVGAPNYLKSVTNPDGEKVELDYWSSDGLLKSYKDANNQTHTFDYDLAGLGRLITDSTPVGGAKSVARTEVSSGHEVSITTKVQASPLIQTTNKYRIAQVASGNTERVVTLHDAVPASAQQITTTVKASGETVTTYPDGTVVTTKEGSDPRFNLQAPFASSTVTQTGGITFEQRHSRTVVTSNPNDPFAITSITDVAEVKHLGGWKASTTVYDKNADRKTTITSHLGRERLIWLDAEGRLKAEQTEGLAKTEYTYFPSGAPGYGRLQVIKHVHGTPAHDRTWELTYVGANLDLVMDPYGIVVADHGHDAAGRVTSVVTPVPGGNTTTSLGYDDNGNTSSVTPPGKPAHAMGYSAADLMSIYNPPDLGGISSDTTSYNQTLDGRPELATLPNNGAPIPQLDWVQDPVWGRLSELNALNAPAGTGYDLDYVYHASGPSKNKLKEVIGPAGNLKITLQYAGRLPTETWWDQLVGGTQKVQLSYDDNLRPHLETINDASSITYDYDDDGLLTTAGALTLTRDAQHGLVTGTTLTIGANTINEPVARTYTPFGEPTFVQLKRNGTNLLERKYTASDAADQTMSGYDKRGRVVVMRERVLGAGAYTTFAYSYDEAGRLKTVTKNGSAEPECNPQCTYDANGNRIGPGTPWTYDAQDRITASPSASSYSYGPNGELASKITAGGTWTYKYDARGNLRQVVRPGTPPNTIDYVVDGLDRRVARKADGVLQKVWLYRGSRIVAELDGGGNLVARFAFGTDVSAPEYMYVPSTASTYRLVTDHLGGVRLVVKVGGTITQAQQQIRYDAWGKVISDTSAGFQPFGFAGGHYDELTGLVRFGARDYDPETGRWTAKDPARFGGGDANLYRYAFSDPINLRDPSGNIVIVDDILVGGGIAAGVGAGLTAGFLLGKKGYCYYRYLKCIASKNGTGPKGPPPLPYDNGIPGVCVDAEEPIDVTDEEVDEALCYDCYVKCTTSTGLFGWPVWPTSEDCP